MSYGFDNKEDSSESNRDLGETKNADIDGALKLKGERVIHRLRLKNLQSETPCHLTLH